MNAIGEESNEERSSNNEYSKTQHLHYFRVRSTEVEAVHIGGRIKAALRGADDSLADYTFSLPSSAPNLGTGDYTCRFDTHSFCNIPMAQRGNVRAK